ncbi:hypothetical protein [Aureimonas psammosilenae]|uniref:hypothetical protein n=1 Tax=Aureimonas psammosilenae TaxID=2495496 RepID=UPI001261046B|nr:hypothetical protein [Aureimonas psammosilenae]
MVRCLGLAGAALLLAGCTSTVVPYEAYGPEEARCASIRQFTPIHERGTRKDPTAEARSPCYAYPDQARPAGFGRTGTLYPLRAFVDAANTD